MKKISLKFKILFRTIFIHVYIFSQVKPSSKIDLEMVLNVSYQLLSTSLQLELK